MPTAATEHTPTGARFKAPFASGERAHGASVRGDTVALPARYSPEPLSDRGNARTERRFAVTPWLCQRATPPNPLGGQALPEGVLVRTPVTWAVAVRRPDGEIHSESHAVDERWSRLRR